MDLDYKHFSGNRLPKEIFEMIGLIEKFDVYLKAILFEELRLGNKISSLEKGYPDEGSMIVSLKNAFSKKYDLEGVKFQSLNDPHYWSAEYSSGTPLHLIVS